MIFGLLILCAISIFASLVTELFNIPVPGAILGLLLLTGICVLRGKTGASLDCSSQVLTILIPLLIMPSCIGIMDHWHLIKKEWLAILIAISSSVIFTLVTTPWLIEKLEKSQELEES
ncbi:MULTISPECIES: CidA/LrgA family protein [unclassified Oleiphilus]|uniref:CidA/LrgA family protein n=1 Tax=unclassified Oleiphilus TaxID=2631174 RepID=UPI0007C20A82|nr:MULTISPECIES: CidA/LrgA family protein [unclassified Oleiphilus]KZZ37084.1 hypothetical protein A3757_12610 [Oleiphilus sp. HI0117]KZZ39590.1 hypothetical protein A3757_22785 [Oleiphilus sp. HI0117]KZZ56105.1 hypothetical protein A3761_09980 [Oleiphilus sp. HI0123]